MIDRVIEFSIRHKLAIILVVVAASVYGWWSILHTRLDALPELGDTQVIIFSRWNRSPDLVEAQAEVQDVLRKNLTRMGYRVLLVGGAERAAERYRESPTDAVIFDADGLGSETLEALTDMHEKAHEDGHPLVALVLLSPRQAAIKDKLPTGDRLIVLVKPIKLKQVQDAITELLPLN